MSYHSFSAAGDIVRQLATSFGMDLKLLEVRLQREWAQVVGAPLAAHTQPGPIKFRKLTVVTEHSVWSQQLVFLKPILLERLREFTGKPVIEDLTFRVGRIASISSPLDPPTEPRSRNHPPSSSASTMIAAASVTRMLQHDDLRHAMTVLIAKALAASPSQ